MVQRVKYDTTDDEEEQQRNQVVLGGRRQPGSQNFWKRILVVLQHVVDHHLQRPRLKCAENDLAKEERSEPCHSPAIRPHERQHPGDEVLLVLLRGGWSDWRHLSWSSFRGAREAPGVILERAVALQTSAEYPSPRCGCCSNRPRKGTRGADRMPRATARRTPLDPRRSHCA